MKRAWPVIGFLALMWLMLFGIAQIGGAYDDLVCDRAQGQCRLTHRTFWLFGHATWTWPVDDLRGAELVSRSVDNLRTPVNGVALLVEGRRAEALTLSRLDVRTRSSTGQAALATQAAAINAYVADRGQPRLAVAEGDPAMALLTSFGVGVLGTWVVLRGLRHGRRRARRG